MAAYTDKIRCLDCDSVLLRKNLKQHYLRHHENKTPKFRSITTVAIDSLLKNVSEKRSRTDTDQEESPTEKNEGNYSNFKRSRSYNLENENLESVPEENNTKMTNKIPKTPDSVESSSATALLKELLNKFDGE